MAQKRQRVAAVIAAGIFLVSSLAASIGVIYLLATNKDKSADTSTAKTDTSQQQSTQSKLIGTQMENFTPTDTPVTELQITDTTVGTGAEAKTGSTVTVEYVGALVKTGVIFDASPEGKPVSLSLNQVIEGWQKGVPGMKVGGKRRLVIPAAQAYGATSPSAAIPANSDLVFDITLTAVQ